MKINFTPQARDDLLSIRNWIAKDDEAAADRVVSRIRQTIMMFSQFPLIGHAGEVAETREFKVTGLPYVIVYRVVAQSDLDILTIVHSSRKYPA